MPKTVADRLQELVNARFEGNVKGFAKRCADVGGSDAPSYETVRKYIAGATPGLDKAAIMARAGGVSLEWLATGGAEKERADPEEGAGPIAETLRRPKDTDYPGAQPGSVEPAGTPAVAGETLLLRVTLEVLGRDVPMDFLIRGRGEEVRVPASLSFSKPGDGPEESK